MKEFIHLSKLSEKDYKMSGSCGEFYGALNTAVEAILYTIIHIAIIIVASLLNITIIILIKTRPILHNPSFILLAALACSDLAMVCLSGTLYLTITLNGNSSGGTIKMATCYIISSITVNNLLLLCCITQDRYQCIKHSMDSRPYTTMRKAYVKIVFCLITSILVSSTFFIEAKYDLPFRADESLFIIISGSFLYIIVYYFKLSKAVKFNRINSTLWGQEDSNGGAVRRPPSCYSNLNKSIFLLVASYIVAYLPGAVTGSIRNISSRLNVAAPKGVVFATAWSATFSLSNSLMDPLVYSYRSDAIGKELRKVCAYIYIYLHILTCNLQEKFGCK